jgi:hypothetical protein
VCIVAPEPDIEVLLLATVLGRIRHFTREWCVSHSCEFVWYTNKVAPVDAVFHGVPDIGCCFPMFRLMMLFSDIGRGLSLEPGNKIQIVCEVTPGILLDLGDCTRLMYPRAMIN